MIISNNLYSDYTTSTIIYKWDSFSFFLNLIDRCLNTHTHTHTHTHTPPFCVNSLFVQWYGQWIEQNSASPRVLFTLSLSLSLFPFTYLVVGAFCDLFALVCAIVNFYLTSRLILYHCVQIVRLQCMCVCVCVCVWQSNCLFSRL